VQFSFSMFFSVFCPIPVPIVCISHFLCFLVFFFFFCHIAVPTVCISHVEVFQFSRHIPCPTV
jgi:hypothetical protein